LPVPDRDRPARRRPRGRPAQAQAPRRRLVARHGGVLDDRRRVAGRPPAARRAAASLTAQATMRALRSTRWAASASVNAATIDVIVTRNAGRWPEGPKAPSAARPAMEAPTAYPSPVPPAMNVIAVPILAGGTIRPASAKPLIR